MCYHIEEEERLMKLRWLVNVLFIEEITEQDLEIVYNNSMEDEDNDW